MLEGGLGHNTLNGGGGGGATGIASYEHAASGVTVDLNVTTEQTVAPGMFDTLVNIQDIYGSAHDDTIIGNSASNYFLGNGGADTFRFNVNMGFDGIGDFVTGQDKIDLNFSAPFTDEVSFQAWAAGHVTAQTGSTMITFDASDSIFLLNVNKANLHASDFIVHS